MRQWIVIVVCTTVIFCGCGQDAPEPNGNDLNDEVRHSDAGDIGGTPPSETTDADSEDEDYYPYGHCGDGELSGDETDVDCGGSCIPCQIGQSCKVRSDCVTLECDQEQFVCVQSSCPEGCSLTGTCNEGMCECNPGWTGPDCSQPKCIDDCSGNGTCDGGICDCDDGWSGIDCSEPAN